MRELFSICGGEERKAQNTAEQIFWVIPASYGSFGQYLLSFLVIFFLFRQVQDVYKPLCGKVSPTRPLD